MKKLEENDIGLLSHLV